MVPKLCCDLRPPVRVSRVLRIEELQFNLDLTVRY